MRTGPVGIGLGQAQSHLRGQPPPCKARSFIPIITSSLNPLLSQHPTTGKGRLCSFLSGDPSSALISVLWAPRATVVLSKPCCSSETALCHHRSLDHTLELTRISESDSWASVLLQNLSKSLRSSSRFETPQSIVASWWLVLQKLYFTLVLGRLDLISGVSLMPCKVSCEGTEKRLFLFGKQGRLPEGRSLEIWEDRNIRCSHDGCLREESATEEHRASLGQPSSSL